jgi:hypothetical protein
MENQNNQNENPLALVQLLVSAAMISYAIYILITI